MKTKVNQLLLATMVGVVSATMVGCDMNERVRSEPTTDHANQVFKDQNMAGEVRTALNADSSTYPDVKVDVYHAVVQLSGFVDTSEQKKRAKELAAKVSGVKKVDNNITLKNNAP